MTDAHPPISPLPETRETPETGDDATAVRAVEERIARAFSAGDADAVADCYTEDALLILPFRPSLSGRRAIADHYRQALSRVTLEIEPSIEETEVAGDWAFQRGSIRQKVSVQGGSAVHRSSGRYLLVARRGDDGSWRVARDVFTPDQPPPRPGLLARLLRLVSR
jgi:uncharacterized protein (TIGR02246 family)